METEYQEQVVEEVGNLGDDLFLLVGHRRNEDLRGLFADFSENLFVPGEEETAGVGTFSRIAVAILDHVKDPSQVSRFAFPFGLPARPYLGNQATVQFQELLAMISRCLDKI